MQTQQQTVDRPYVDPSQNIVGAILIKMDSLAESDPEEALVLSGGLMGTELGFDYIWKTTAPLCRALCFEVRSRAFAALKDWAKAKEAARAGLAIVDEATEQGIPSEDSCAWEHIEETMRDVIKEANAAITADAEGEPDLTVSSTFGRQISQLVRSEADRRGAS